MESHLPVVSSPHIFSFFKKEVTTECEGTCGATLARSSSPSYVCFIYWFSETYDGVDMSCHVDNFVGGDSRMYTLFFFSLLQ